MSVQQVKCVLAQLNFHVGDFEGNTNKIIEACKQAVNEHQADLVVFSELALCAYPPEDLLLRPSLAGRVTACFEHICRSSKDWNLHIVLGYPERDAEGNLFNSAAVLYKGEQVANYRKQCLPNYQVFDEKRYFSSGKENSLFQVKGLNIALSICEDIWFEKPSLSAKEAGAELILNINASPFHLGKLEERKRVLHERSSSLHLPVIYSHCVGAQDELVFDGGSMAYDGQGECVLDGLRFHETLIPLSISSLETGKPLEISLDGSEENCIQKEAMSELEELRQALVIGVRDYVNKNGFKGVVLGLSGGIDSALTLAIACEALGKERVEAVMMPFRYTSQMSQEDAAQQAKALGVKYSSIAIENIYSAFMDALAEEFQGTEVDTTEENLQARCRGVLLMAISNKKAYLVLTTGNKSEMAVGYSTLYGDMAGGFDVLKDVPKTMVFRLAEYLNESCGKEVVPQRVIDRPPSAELAPDQKDEDSLPPYDVLDQILEMYIEQDLSAEAIIEKGFEEEQVFRVLRLVDVNEYKRRQAPIGTRITSRGFGKDRRYPITNGWKIGD
jgi:NAD+ synthase (glutamine-hydrolysing)